MCLSFNLRWSGHIYIHIVSEEIIQEQKETEREKRDASSNIRFVCNFYKYLRLKCQDSVRNIKGH